MNKSVQIEKVANGFIVTSMPVYPINGFPQEPGKFVFADRADMESKVWELLSA